MQIITLTTEWKSNDYYSGIIKGKIYAHCKDVNVIDIANNIKPFDFFKAAFLIKSAYKHFPENTIHLILVNSGYFQNSSSCYHSLLYHL